MPDFVKTTKEVEASKNKRDQLPLGFTKIEKTNSKKPDFVYDLDTHMLKNKLNRALMEIRFQNPNLYR